MAVIKDDQERFPFIIGGERGGKALGVDEDIPTLSGWKKMGDLVAGDYVFTEDGSPTLVTEAHPVRLNRDCFRVTFEDGQSIIADSGHLWVVQDENQRKNECRQKRGGREVRVVAPVLISDRSHSVLTTAQLLESGLQVPATGSRSAFNRFSTVTPLAPEYPEAELPVPPYVMGAWLGDGAARSGFISGIDDELFARVSRVGFDITKQPDGYYVRGLIPGLRRAGVLGDKHIPGEYLVASVEQRWELLRGLMDTDGYCDARGQSYFDNTNKRIVDGVVELAFSLGLKPTVTEGRAVLDGVDCGPTWTVFMMARDPLFTLSRKLARQNLAPAGHSRHRYISSIERVGSVPVRCITVAAPSGIFLAGRSYALTHNSMSVRGIVVPHALLLPKIRQERFYDERGRLKFNSKDPSSKPRNPDIALFGPTYAEPRVEFQYIEDDLRALGKLPPGWRHISKPQDGPWRMTTTDGVVIATWSMEDPGTIRAVDLELAAICEAGKCPYEGVERVHGRVSAKRGMIIYSGTLEESHQWYRDWAVMGQRPNFAGIKTYSIPTWTNRHEFPGGRQDPEILRLEQLYGEELFAMRCAGEPRPPRYRVLKEVTPAHVVSLDYDDILKEHPEAELKFCVDPGYASAYAVLLVAVWQVEVEEWEAATQSYVKVLRKRFHFIDEIYEQGLTTPAVIALLKKNPLWAELEKTRKSVFDIASKGHRDAGESALEIWKRNLPRWEWNMRYWKEERLIERLRTSAHNKQFTIDPRCKGLLAEAGLGEPVFNEMHPWKYQTARDGTVTSEKPLDKWNHSAKAAGYLLLDELGQVEHVAVHKAQNRLKNRPNRTQGTIASTRRRR